MRQVLNVGLKMQFSSQIFNSGYLQSFHYSDVYESLLSEHLTKMKDAATALGSRQTGLERSDIMYPKLTHL